MESRETWSSETWERLLRRAQVVVEHHRYHGQPVDVHEVVQRVLASHLARPAKIVRYRALLQEAVESFVRGFR